MSNIKSLFKIAHIAILSLVFLPFSVFATAITDSNMQFVSPLTYPIYIDYSASYVSEDFVQASFIGDDGHKYCGQVFDGTGLGGIIGNATDTVAVPVGVKIINWAYGSNITDTPRAPDPSRDAWCLEEDWNDFYLPVAPVNLYLESVAQNSAGTSTIIYATSTDQVFHDQMNLWFAYFAFFTMFCFVVWLGKNK